MIGKTIFEISFFIYALLFMHYVFTENARNKIMKILMLISFLGSGIGFFIHFIEG